MKLFRQLLVAPAALGLMVPVAASAADLNLNGVKEYAADEQVTSISQFSDVKPTDWAYQALSNLIERYGCVAGYPNGTYRGGQAMTRYEAAALLNACLDRISETTDEIKRLVKEFEKELAVLRGRVDGLEAKVAELEANQFSTTTKLKGQATFLMGANNYSGNYVNPAAFGRVPAGRTAAQYNGAFAFNYDVRLNFDTSFTGKDLLRTTLRSGNAAVSPFGAAINYRGLGVSGTQVNATEALYQEANSGPNVVAINRLFYQFPVGSGLTVTVGSMVRQDDMLAMWPSAYPADTVMDFMTYAGAPGTYSLNLGAGAGVVYKNNGWGFALNYVSADGGSGNPAQGGIMTSASASTLTAQLGYAASNWGVAAAYNYANGGGNWGNQTYNLNAGALASGTPLAFSAANSSTSISSWALSAYWTPSQASWVPSISAGFGFNYNSGVVPGAIVTNAVTGSVTTASWTVGLQWADAFVKGNTAGIGFGQPTFVTTNTGLGSDAIWSWEFWYKFQVTDNISVTPAIFYFPSVGGALTNGTFGSGVGAGNGTLSNWGGLVKTTFKF